jgi:hypothetical protein
VRRAFETAPLVVHFAGDRSKIVWAAG